MWLTASADVTHTPNGWRVISPWGLMYGYYRDKGDRLCLPFFVAYPARGVVLCLRLLPCHLPDVGGTTAETLAVGRPMVSLGLGSVAHIHLLRLVLMRPLRGAGGDGA